jgi:serine/threonine protein kinase
LWFGLVQGYIPGFSLKELVEKGVRFSEERVEAIAGEILQILIYLHGLNPPILHRDIKPSNLIQGKDGHIYLVDFGSVQDKALAEGSTFTIVGTYGYCPLEQFGGKACAASDLYALGATLIHLLTGVAPADLPTKNLRLQFRHLVTADPFLVRWLEKLVEPDLEHRLAIAQEALDLLERRIIMSPNQQRKIRIRKPAKSRVVLKAFPDRLEISIPRRRFQSFEDYLHGCNAIAFMGVISLFFLFSPGVLLYGIVWWLIWGAFAWRSLAQLCRETQILFTRHIFSITKNLWGLPYFSSKGLTAKVQDISLAHQTFSKWGTSSYRPGSIMMTCEAILNENRYDRRLFGEGLNEEELIWLAQEIRSWLFDYDRENN